VTNLASAFPYRSGRTVGWINRIMRGRRQLWAPRTDSVTPATGPAGGGTGLTLVGFGYLLPGSSGITVSIGGIACTSVTPTQNRTLTCTTAAGMAVGVRDVVVSTPNGTHTFPAAFTVT
jgi:hypothetical protein